MYTGRGIPLFHCRFRHVVADRDAFRCRLCERLEWQPPVLVVFSFHPGRDNREAQTVKVTFSPAPEGARVVLTHSGWEKLGANAQQSRDSYERGWESVFVTAYREHIQNGKRRQGN